MQPSPSPRVAALDGVRGLAIVSVLAWHYVAAPLPWDSPWALRLHALLAYAWSGVDLFFVLSGFLIGGIVLDARRTPNFLRVFYGRRALRILPLYWVILLGWVVSRAFLAPHLPEAARAMLHDNGHPLLTYLGFGQNIATGLLRPSVPEPSWLNVTWSLAVEEHFYLVVPLAAVALPEALVPWVLGIVVAAGPLVRWLVLHRLGSDAAVYLLTPCRIDTLVLGVLCAWAMRRPGFRASLRRAPLYATIAVTGAAVALSHVRDLGPTFTLLGYSVIAVLCAALLFLASVEQRGPVAWLLRSRLLQRCGLLAYGLYLLHQPVNGLAHALVLRSIPTLATLPSAALTAGSLVVTFALAELSWRFLERPLVAVGHRMRYAHASNPGAHARPGAGSEGPARRPGERAA